jgi:hypothetical protein
MTIVYGLLSAEPTNRDRSALSRLEHEIGADTVARTVLDVPGLVLRLSGGESLAAATVLGTTSDGVRVAVVGRLAKCGELESEIPRLDWQGLADALSARDGYWIAFGHDEKSCATEMLCDRLGVAWLYWAKVPGGVAFSSDFGALARSMPAHPRLNDAASLLALTLTYPVGDATCFDEIQVVSPSSILRFTGSTVSRRRSTPAAYGDRFAGATRDTKFEALDAILDASYETWSLPSASSPWTVALSSGNDSRYGLGLLMRHQERPACATFGLPGSDDVRGATAICRRERLEHTFFTTDRQTSWDSWRAAVQRLGAVAGFQYGAGWAHDWRRTLGTLGRQVVLGFLGDALSGAHLVDRFDGNWLANWEAWSIDLREDGTWSGSEMLRPEVRSRARDAVRAALAGACQDVHVAFEHQKALHLDLYCRQRRITASQVNFLTDEIPVAPLFYTAGMVAFWSNLDYADLKRQALYLAYARDRFPNLFAPSRPPSLYRRARGTLTNLAIGLYPSLKRHLAPPEIDTRALIGQHLEQMRSLIRDYGEAVDHIVDVAALNRWLDQFRTRESVNAPRLQRFWNLLLLVEAGFAGRRASRDSAARRAASSTVTLS